MFFQNRVIAVFVCIGVGIVPQFAAADLLNSGKELIASIRSYQSPVAKHDQGANGASAIPHHRHAKTYVDQNDIGKANASFGLALQNATPKQVPAIASDYVAFLESTGDLHKAELVLRQALTQVPNDVELIRMLARCLVLQDKMIEGLRYLKSIGPEAEAKAEIAEIYRERGDTDMLAAVEKKWGTSRPARPESVRQEPALLATTSRPARSESVRPETALVATTSRPARPESALVATTTPKSIMLPPEPNTKVEILPPAEIVSTMPSTMRALPPTPVVAVPNGVALEEEVVVIAATPVVPPRSKSELFDTKIPVPIPVPNSDPQPMVTIARSPKSASMTLIPKLPVPIPASAPLTVEEITLVNPAKLVMAPLPSDLALSEEREPPRPTVMPQPRKHYVVNADTAADVDTLFPVKPAAIVMPVQGSVRLSFSK